jgi:hypothetical protein
MKKKAMKLEKMNARFLEFIKIFRHFTTFDWIYEIKKIIEIMNMLSPEERLVFNCNPKTIDWEIFTQLNVYGY